MLRPSTAERHWVTAVGLLGAAPVFYLIHPEAAGRWLAALHVLAAVVVLTRSFWVRWLVLGLSGGDLLVGLLHVFEPTPARAWSLLALAVVLSVTLARLNHGEAIARRYDGQGAWAHRHRLEASAVRRIKRSFIAMGLSLPLLAELIGHKLPESRRPELAWSALALIALGGFGLLRQRTWSLSALTTAAALIAAFTLSSRGLTGLAAAGATTALIVAVAPFARPVYVALREAAKEPPHER